MKYKSKTQRYQMADIKESQFPIIDETDDNNNSDERINGEKSKKQSRQEETE